MSTWLCWKNWGNDKSSRRKWDSNTVKVKVKCTTLVQALRLCTGRTAHRGSRGITLLFHDHGTRRRWEVSVTLRPLFTRGKDTVPIVQEAGWAPGPVWTGAETLDPTGIRSPDRPARSHSLYRLRYPAHSNTVTLQKFVGKMRIWFIWHRIRTNNGAVLNAMIKPRLS